jgi:hypothetical protein
MGGKTVEEKLRDMGLTTNQIKSNACQKTIEAIMPDDMSALLEYFRTQMNDTVQNANKQMNELHVNCMKFEKTISALSDSFAQTTTDLAKMDERAMSAFVLYSSVLKASMSVLNGNSFRRDVIDDANIEAIKTAGFIVYAYLGGQARRIYEGGEDTWQK